jgi:hypothetical protein
MSVPNVSWWFRVSGMVARLPLLCRVWQADFSRMLAAAAAGSDLVAGSCTNFTSRAIAPCCARKRRQVFVYGEYYSRQTPCAEGSKRVSGETVKYKILQEILDMWRFFSHGCWYGENGFGGGKEREWPNKRLHTTATALASFGIRTRPQCLGGFAGCVLPVRARLRLVKRSVSPYDTNSHTHK